MEYKRIAGAYPEPYKLFPHEIISLEHLVSYIKFNPIEKISKAIQKGSLQPYYFDSYSENYNKVYLHCCKFDFHPDWLTEYYQKLDGIIFLQSEAQDFYQEGVVPTTSPEQLSAKKVSEKQKEIIFRCTTQSAKYTKKRNLSAFSDSLTNFSMWGLKKAFFHFEKILKKQKSFMEFTDYSPIILKNIPTVKEEFIANTASVKITYETCETMSEIENSIPLEVHEVSVTKNDKAKHPNKRVLAEQENKKPLKSTKQSASKKYIPLSKINTMKRLAKFTKDHAITEENSIKELIYLLSIHSPLYLWQIGKVLRPNRPSNNAYKQAAIRWRDDHKKERKKNGFKSFLASELVLQCA